MALLTPCIRPKSSPLRRWAVVRGESGDAHLVVRSGIHAWSDHALSAGAALYARPRSKMDRAARPDWAVSGTRLQRIQPTDDDDDDRTVVRKHRCRIGGLVCDICGAVIVGDRQARLDRAKPHIRPPRPAPSACAPDLALARVPGHFSSTDRGRVRWESRRRSFHSPCPDRWSEYRAGSGAS